MYCSALPLYKVRKGKTDHYLKDEAELNDFLVDLVLNMSWWGSLKGKR